MAALAACGADGDLLALDCAEFPCIALLDGAWEQHEAGCPEVRAAFGDAWDAGWDACGTTVYTMAPRVAGGAFPDAPYRALAREASLRLHPPCESLK